MMGDSSIHSNGSLDSTPASLAVVAVSDNKIVEFKKPLQPLQKKKKRKVLDEETYVHQLGKIIERDFFPDLDNLKDKVEYLDARQNNDLERLQSLYRKYSTGGRLPTPASVVDSPPTFDTPEPNQLKRKKVAAAATPLPNIAADAAAQAKTDTSDATASSKPGENELVGDTKKLSLDEFLALNTSEDDDSFEQIMEDCRQKFLMKKAWMFNAEALHNAQHAPDLTMKALPANEHEARAIEKEEQSRPQAVENWKFKTFNSIMYVPDDHHPSRARELQLAGKAPREVVHNNTRFDTNPFVKPLNQATVREASAVQAIKKEGRIGVDGRELSKETPRVRGYSFVGEASPVPGVEESPLMTWGEVEGTPFQLDKSSTPLIHSSSSGPSYSMPKVPYRDVIALQLNEKANQAQRDKKSKALSAARSSLCSPLVSGGANSKGSSERWASERITHMSPAAKRLLSSGLGVRQNTDITLRASYTPSHSTFTPTDSARRMKNRNASSRRTSYLTPSPGVAKSKVGCARLGVGTPNNNDLCSPGVHSKSKSNSSSAASSSLTDGLLQLPKRTDQTDEAQKISPGRQCASDFF